MKAQMKALAAIGLLLLLAWPCWAVTYYVSPGETYETFNAFHAAITPQPGDTVDGLNGFIYGTLTLNNSGTVEAPITYQNFTLHYDYDYTGSTGDWGWNATNNAWKREAISSIKDYWLLLGSRRAIGGTLPLPNDAGYYYIDRVSTPKLIYLSGSTNPATQWNLIQATHAYGVFDTNGKSNIVVKNAHLKYGGLCSVYLKNGSNNYKFIDCSFYCSQKGFYVAGTNTNIFVDHCDFDEFTRTVNGLDYHGAGFDNSGVSNLEISHCTWDGEVDIAIRDEPLYTGIFYHQEWSSGQPTNIRIHHNELHNHGYIGIYVKDENAGGSIFNADVKIYANRIINTAQDSTCGSNRYGIQVKGKSATSYPTNVEIYQNYITNTNFTGIAAFNYAGPDIKIYGNYLNGCSGRNDDDIVGGILVSNGAIVANNTIISHPDGSNGLRNYTPDIPAASDTIISNNLFINNGDDSSSWCIFADDHSNVGVNNWFFDAATGREIYGTPNITNSTIGVDPLRIAEHLTFNSPCRNAGIEVPGISYPSRDIDNEKIMNTPDIGCDEFHIVPAGGIIPVLGDSMIIGDFK